MPLFEIVIHIENQLTLIAWVKVFRITTEFYLFSLLRGHFFKPCKSG